MSRIYLDYAATTPIHPLVRDSMLPWLSEFGNPSSLHAEGRRAKDAIDEAREIISSSLGAEFGEVTFTSSGTEAANLAILGAALANSTNRRRVLMSAVEHHCVLNLEPLLTKLGYQVECLPVDRQARVSLEPALSALRDDVFLVSVMHANNELGTWQPVVELFSTARHRGILTHLDAVQTFATYPWTPRALSADLVSVSAHKIEGPKGVGALYTRAGVKVSALMRGGGQEREMRAGTENVANIVGFGRAAQQTSSNKTRSQRQRAARNEFVSALHPLGVSWSTPFDESVLSGHAHGRIPGRSAEGVLIRLDRHGIAASSGAACSSGSLEPSHVLRACGYSDPECKEGLRFTFGPETDGREAALAVLRALLNSPES